jgi:methionyl-tRNA formyltransferase
MRIGFAGTPAFAAQALRALLDAGHEVPLVFTQPGRPAGRGMKLRLGAVGELAQERGLPLLMPRTLRAGRAGADGNEAADEAVQALRRLQQADCELLVVAAYGLILPQRMLDIPRGVVAAPAPAAAAAHGQPAPERIRALNIHASLLPRWRGAAPVARAIEAGDARTGVTLMQMEAGLDTGPMLQAEAVTIGPDESAGALTQRLAELGARMLVTALQHTDRWRPQAQPADGVTYAAKIDRREAWIDWTRPAPQIARTVRAFDPQPGACGRLGGAIVKVWAARAIEAPAGARPDAQPGQVLAAGPDALCVACGSGVLAIGELQRAGGRRLPARAFLSGTPVPAGARWDLADGGPGPAS